ncbi:hypothetical protein N624_0734 [Levilactobacillus brevis]|nr:hypothetical protein N624_0734 [Levilactobacillus brevis]
MRKVNASDAQKEVNLSLKEIDQLWKNANFMLLQKQVSMHVPLRY